jgi:hypothetical protein
MKKLQHKFVEFIPEQLEDGIIYITMEYGTAVHKCICGCGNDVVTPFSPTDWQLIYDGESISLYPSIGNWNFKCKSHYWITKSKIKKAKLWSEEEIKSGREIDKKSKSRYYKKKKYAYSILPHKVSKKSS